MGKHKPSFHISGGFTIVEVTLVLAISMFLFIGVIGGTSINVTRQRYNDSVQNFAEFLRREYSEVISTENTRDNSLGGDAPCTITSPSSGTLGNSNQSVQTGRSNCLIYGKLITFGEYTPSKNSYDIVYSYDVIGDDIDSRELAALNSDANGPYSYISNEVIRSLANVSADVLTVRREGGSCKMSPAGNTASYQLEWGAYPQTTSNTNFRGSVLIVRSPLSGAVDTIVLDDPVPVQEGMNTYRGGLAYNECYQTAYRNNFSNYSLKTQLTRTSPPYQAYQLPSYKDVELCVASDDIFAIGNRKRMVSISSDGHNASAVRVATQDSGDNKCQ
ncbi:hypothetical protein IJI55_01310 [Candidatus Saccharibacteria bacterium]|nr:hypothetical protein [Candidatus Saccharibacteria bacterium]MBR3323264.1 hypothetical protein [Candidatus Saccharibacteria bacterium]